jgi:hypothetical protein
LQRCFTTKEAATDGNALETKCRKGGGRGGGINGKGIKQGREYPRGDLEEKKET